MGICLLMVLFNRIALFPQNIVYMEVYLVITAKLPELLVKLADGR